MYTAFSISCSRRSLRPLLGLHIVGAAFSTFVALGKIKTKAFFVTVVFCATYAQPVCQSNPSKLKRELTTKFSIEPVVGLLKLPGGQPKWPN